MLFTWNPIRNCFAYLSVGLVRTNISQGFTALLLTQEKKDEVAQLVANLLERRGHQWESTAVRADCRAKDTKVVLCVDGSRRSR